MPPSFYDGVILVQWLDKNNGLPLVSFVEHHTLQMIAATLQKKTLYHNKDPVQLCSIQESPVSISGAATMHTAPRTILLME